MDTNIILTGNQVRKEIKKGKDRENQKKRIDAAQKRLEIPKQEKFEDEQKPEQEKIEDQSKTEVAEPPRAPRKKRDLVANPYKSEEIEEFNTYLDEYKDFSVEQIIANIKELRKQKFKLMRDMGKRSKTIGAIGRDEQNDDDKKFFRENHKEKSEKQKRMAALYKLKMKKEKMQENPEEWANDEAKELGIIKKKMGADINLFSKMPSYLRPFSN